MPKVAMTLEEAKITEYGFVATGDAQAGPVARLSGTVVPLSPSRPSCCEMLKEKKSCSNPEILNTSFVQKTKLKFYQKIDCNDDVVRINIRIKQRQNKS